MKKLLFALLVLACFVKDGKTCMDFDSSFDKAYLLTPEVITDTAYWPFVFSTNWYYTIPETTLNNEAEWSDFMKGSLGEEDISCLMESIDTNSIKQALQKNREYLGYNLRKPKIKQFFEFLVVSERNAYTYGFYHKDEWDYNSHVVSDTRKENLTLLNDLKSKYETANHPFLKNRYWYQLIRYHFYRSSVEDFDEFFNATLKLQPKNPLYYASIDKYLKKPHRAIETCKRSIQIYDEGNVERFLASKAFYPCTQEMFDTMLHEVKTDREREALWAMFGYFVDEYEAINQINRINPSSDKLDFLLCRLINKLEVDRYLPTSSYLNEEQNFYNVKQLLFLVEKQLNSGKLKNPSNWFLAKGYLQAFSGNYAASMASYQMIDRTKVSKLFKQQLEIFEYFNKVHLCKHWGKEQETEFVEFHKKFPFEIKEGGYDGNGHYYEFATKGESNDLHLLIYYDILRQRIADLYKKQGEIEKAIIVYNQAVYYSSTENMKRLTSFWKVAERDSFFAPFMRSYSWEFFSYDDIRYCYISNLFFDGKFSEAAKELKYVEWSKDSLEDNPFNNNLYSHYPLSTKSPLFNQVFTQYSFLCTMDSLSKVVKRKSVEQSIEARILLIKGMMSMGTNTSTYSFHAFPGYEYTIRNKDDKFNSEKLNARRYNAENVVKPWLMEILNSNASAEQKAFCSVQLAELEFRDYLISIRNSYDYDNIPTLIKPWKGFQLLMKNYSKTKVFSDYLRECTYFQEFLNRRKKGF